MEPQESLWDIICRLTGARAVIHRGPRTVPKILSQWSSPMTLGLGHILPEHGLGILTVPWMDLGNMPLWDYLVHGPKGEGGTDIIFWYWYWMRNLIYGLGWDCDNHAPAINPWVYVVPEGWNMVDRRSQVGRVSYHRGHFPFGWWSWPANAGRSLLYKKDMIYIVTRVRLPASKINGQIVNPLFTFCLISSTEYQVYYYEDRGEGVKPRSNWFNR